MNISQSVEVADERFNLLPLYSGVNAGRAAERGGLDVPVVWPAGAPAFPAGAKVRLKISLRRAAGLEPRLFAVRV